MYNPYYQNHCLSLPLQLQEISGARQFFRSHLQTSLTQFPSRQLFFMQWFLQIALATYNYKHASDIKLQHLPHGIFFGTGGGGVGPIRKLVLGRSSSGVKFTEFALVHVVTDTVTGNGVDVVGRFKARVVVFVALTWKRRTVKSMNPRKCCISLGINTYASYLLAITEILCYILLSYASYHCASASLHEVLYRNKAAIKHQLLKLANTFHCRAIGI